MNRTRLASIAPTRAPASGAYSEIQLLTAQLGAILSVLLTLQFLSGALFYLYVFYYDAPPWFTFTRFLHFYVGIALIPVVLAKYGTTSVRAAGYYLRLPRFRRLGAPPLLARVTSPLLALDFLLIGISGLYMLLHVYYAHTNIPPFEWKPVQTHALASFIAVPLLGLHLGSHLFESARSVKARRDVLLETGAGRQAVYTRRGFLAGVLLSGAGLALAAQNGPLGHGQLGPFFISRGPALPRGASKAQAFPIETLFGDQAIAPEAFRLTIDGAVARPQAFTLADLAALPVHEQRIRTSCVSGWTSVNVWRGYRVRDVLALAGGLSGAQQLTFHSATNYRVPWPAHRLLGDEALLATHVNGEPLITEHGAPLRLIAPGYPGENMVKQVVQITAEQAPDRFAPDLDPRSESIGCCGERFAGAVRGAEEVHVGRPA
ncbi:MAG TPA: molybdopterin-dependent oxidoreductase [Dehalococcoidia bacterium]|jgi:DMSO/TMAO reductase YedYZ molybdopterin-dependent catalytic subunit